MSSPLTRIQPGTVDASEETRVFELDDEEAHDVFDTFSSETTRRLYASLCIEPATPSELASELDASLQNLNYHLDKLQEAGLIREAGTRYSSRGHEMTVYAPRHDPLVFTGTTETKSTLRTELPRVLGGLAVVSGVGLLGQWLLRQANVIGPGAGNVGTAGTDAAANGSTPLLGLLFEPAVLLVLGAVLMALVMLAVEFE
ncbi:ArsR/SmtB family transcription factor [Natronomonas sp.]|uniref:ArsR/SmtB family transcription factor n=1 Tax=Natronomonas sp. TaxID=2184060 RepID=UPI002FC3496B